MPWIMQMVGFALFLVGIAVALWVSVWVLVFLFAVGLVIVIWSSLRSYLVEKGILNPLPGVPQQPMEDVDVTIVEGSFTRVEDKSESH
jgi:hypothetical protein